MITKEKALSNVLWSFGERFSGSVISFIISIVFARKISPEEFGIVALILVFISLADVFVTSGFGVALIQKKDADTNDFSCMLLASTGISIVLYFIIWFSSPYIESAYGYAGLSKMTRVLALKLPISSINGIQHAYISKRLEFRKLFITTFFGKLFAGITGIILVMIGFGPWGLIYHYLISAVLDTIILHLIIDLRFKLFFSYSIFKPLWDYGVRITYSAFTRELYNQIRSLLIGKIYTPADLAYYNRGMQFPQLIMENVNTSLSNVIFPILSNTDNEKTLRELMRKYIRMTSFIVWPAMIGLTIVSESLIRVLLTEKWIESVFYLRIAAISYAILPLSTANLQAIKAIGRADIIAKIETVKRVINLIILFAAIDYGVKAIALGWAVSLFVNTIINMFPNIKLLKYRLLDQIKDISIPMMISILMGIMVFPISYMVKNDILLIFLQIVFGVFFYSILSFAFQNESLRLIFESIVKLTKKNKNENA